MVPAAGAVGGVGIVTVEHARVGLGEAVDDAEGSVHVVDGMAGTGAAAGGVGPVRVWGAVVGAVAGVASLVAGAVVTMVCDLVVTAAGAEGEVGVEAAEEAGVEMCGLLGAAGAVELLWGVGA